MTPRAGLQHSPPPTNAAVVDRVFRALSDPTRRNVLERLSLRPASASELAAPYDMALPSFAQHLRVLEECGLIASEKRGRSRWCRLVKARFDEAANWMEAERRNWAMRLERLEVYLDTTDEG